MPQLTPRFARRVLLPASYAVFRGRGSLGLHFFGGDRIQLVGALAVAFLCYGPVEFDNSRLLTGLALWDGCCALLPSTSKKRSNEMLKQGEVGEGGARFGVFRGGY